MSPVSLLFVPGVGLWPGVFDPIRELLPLVVPSEDSTDEIVWIRPGYDDSHPVDSFERQVDALRGRVTAGGPTLVVGVSGGATLALALLVDPPVDLLGAVTHEPLVGALQPDLGDRVTSAGEALRAAPGAGTAVGFVRGLYGRSWAEVPATAEVWVTDHWATVCDEVAHFASFTPTTEQIAAIDRPHVTTVGSESAMERHAVAALLAQHGARRVVIEGAGHLAPYEAPVEFAGAVRALQGMI